MCPVASKAPDSDPPSCHAHKPSHKATHHAALNAWQNSLGYQQWWLCLLTCAKTWNANPDSVSTVQHPQHSHQGKSLWGTGFACENDHWYAGISGIGHHLQLWEHIDANSACPRWQRRTGQGQRWEGIGWLSSGAELCWWVGMGWGGRPMMERCRKGRRVSGGPVARYLGCRWLTITTNDAHVGASMDKPRMSWMCP